MTRGFNYDSIAKMTGEFYKEQPWIVGKHYYYAGENDENDVPCVDDIEITDVQMRCIVSSVNEELTDICYIYMFKNHGTGKDGRVCYLIPENAYDTYEAAAAIVRSRIERRLVDIDEKVVEYIDERTKFAKVLEELK